MDNLNNNTNEKLSQALHYAEKLGWSIIPVGRNKKPLFEWKKYQNEKASAEQIISWFEKYPNANIAVVTGQISNLTIIDVDPRHNGTDEPFKDIQTVKSKTGGGGWHLYFQYEEGTQTNSGIKPGIDVRSEGGVAVLPPSDHESGNNYEWLVAPDQNNLAPLPEFVKDWIIEAKPKNAEESNWNEEVLNGVGEGKRNESAASVAGKLLKRFPIKEWETEAWQHFVNWNSQNKPPLPEDELRSVFNSIKGKAQAKTEEQKDKNTTLTLQLVEEIKKERIVFFHTPHKEGFAAITGDGREILKLRSRSFKQYIAHYVYRQFDRIISSDMISNITQVLEGKAIFDGPTHELFVRIAKQNNAIWYDLGDGSVVHIDKDGWRVSETPPILFRKFPHQVIQATPQYDGDVAVICDFVNLKNESEKLLFEVFTIASFIPDFPHPLLVLYGPQGAGKTTPLRVLKSLIDPSILKTLSAPDSAREFVQTASHHFFFFLDNLSSLPDWLSDSLARASTGDGFSKRELFSDDEDVIYSFQRTIGLNGINLVIEKADLLDRSILLVLERISKRSRREEQEFWETFEGIKPKLLGAIFTAVSQAINYYPIISLSSYPRMADFARWGCAITRALGYQDQDFLDAYYSNINTQSEAAIDASPVGTTIISFMNDKENWAGTASELLEKLEKEAEKLKINTKHNQWPKQPSWLVRRINLIQPNLAEQGVRVTNDTDSRPKQVIIQKIDRNADDSDMATEDTQTEPVNDPSPKVAADSSDDKDSDNEDSLIKQPASSPTPLPPFPPTIGSQPEQDFKSWSNHFLLWQYDKAVKLGEKMSDSNPNSEEEIQKYEQLLKLIEQIEDEGRERKIGPFIPDEEFEDRIIRILAELTLSEGFIPSEKVAEKIEYPSDRMLKILEKLHSDEKILRYKDEDDLWAVSVATRERLGISSPVKKPIELEVKK